MAEQLYRDYFNIDPKYFPAVTADLVASGEVSWKRFYPHETFVDLLKTVHAVLSGKMPRSIWVEGAYGTGKSHAALTVKSLLEASDDEVRAYFDEFELDKDLCEKFLTAKNAGKVLVIHRMGSSSICSDSDLIWAIQESIDRALSERGIENRAEGTLKDAALRWLEDADHRDFLGKKMAQKKHAWEGQLHIDDVVEQLKTGSSERVTELMQGILAIAKEERMSFLCMDIRSLVDWIKDVIRANALSSIFFVWDEFTEYFQNNSSQLTGFQTIAEISQSSPFYFMIVTHESHSLIADTQLAKKIDARFVRAKIELPENIAFRLLAQAMRKTSDLALLSQWEGYKGEINTLLKPVRDAIRASATRRGGDNNMVVADKDMQEVVPIHPYAAIVLKHIAVVYQSNQRSMFNFVIDDNGKAKAFKWFIANTGPTSAWYLLTVDMLWDFFTNSQSGLNSEVREVLDSYRLISGEKLNNDEHRVLKVILLFNAISMRMHDTEMVRPSDKNIDLSFVGASTNWPKGRGKQIAEKLCRDGILFKEKMKDGSCEYKIANISGGSIEISEKKKEVEKRLKTYDLIGNAELHKAIAVPDLMENRFKIDYCSVDTLSRKISELKSADEGNKFKVLVGFARDEVEAEKVKKKIADEAEKGAGDVLLVDASATPFGRDRLERYIENVALSEYYTKKDRERSNKYMANADACLGEWRDAMMDGSFWLYAKDDSAGKRMANMNELKETFQSIDREKYPYGLEHYEVSKPLFGLNQMGKGVECGVNQENNGVYNEASRAARALEGAWKVERYWKDPAKQGLTIVKIKQKVEDVVASGFESESGRVSMDAIYSALQEPPFGLMQCSMTAFVLGFVLKEYVNENYFWSDGSTSEPMSIEKMKSMVIDAMNEGNSSSRKATQYIVAMSAEQKAFLKCSAQVFHLAPEKCGSIESVGSQIRLAMKALPFPIWSVKYALPAIDGVSGKESVLEGLIDAYCHIANTNNAQIGNESEIATRIGKIVREDGQIVDDLSRILVADNCCKGMTAYLAQYRNGELQSLASELGDNGAYIKEVQRRFSASDANWVWNTDTAKEKIDDVILDYKIILESKKSIPNCDSIKSVVKGWTSRANRIKISFDAMKKSVGDLRPFLEIICTMCMRGELEDQNRSKFYELLREHRVGFDNLYNSPLPLFKSVVSEFVTQMNDDEIERFYKDLAEGQYTKTKNEYYSVIGAAVKEFLSKQLRTKVLALWKEKTGTKDPKVWSENNEIPILCMFGPEDRIEAKKVFDTMLGGFQQPNDAKNALEYLERATFYDKLADAEARDRCFIDVIVGDYKILIDDIGALKEYIQEQACKLEVYDWIDNEMVKDCVKSYADRLYKTDGEARARAVIDEMNADDLREYLIELIDNVNIGIEILKSQQKKG